MSLYVAYVRATGHVVGAVGAVGATPSADVAALVGSELGLRVSLSPTEVVELTLDAKDMDSHTVDDEPKVFDDPLVYAVEQVPNADPKPALARLRTGVTVAFTADRLVVTVPVADPVKAIAVVALVSGDSILQHSTIPAGKTSADFAATVPSGQSRGVLALVAGWAGVLEAVKQK
ncbi:hypothetical protein V5P93_003478 [Actinokineospora auranticolor]|uniref:Uncharacterized protein n=1 Tax=Actinokineospora auranticolor TaxID=155976 RepID=A0A2S6GPU0_9PSEU|nr:hypothetical protein [Actinokineospora auranticolor]PPK67141.1 hypothetical protein CLV40_108138 [Actinokineospora auranticolor]